MEMLPLVGLVKFILNPYLEFYEDCSHTLLKTSDTVYLTFCTLVVMNITVLDCVIKCIVQEGDGTEAKQLYNKHVMRYFTLRL